MADPPEVLQRRGGLKGTWQEARQEGARGVGKRSDTDCLLAISFCILGTVLVWHWPGS